MECWYTAFPALHLSTAVHAAVAASCGSRLGGEKPLHVTSVQKQFSQFGEEEAGLLCVPKPGRPRRRHPPAPAGSTSRILKPSPRPSSCRRSAVTSRDLHLAAETPDTSSAAGTETSVKKHGGGKSFQSIFLEAGM